MLVLVHIQVNDGAFGSMKLYLEWEIEWSISLLHCKKKKKKHPTNPVSAALGWQQSFAVGEKRVLHMKFQHGASRVQKSCILLASQGLTPSL